MMSNSNSHHNNKVLDGNGNIKKKEIAKQALSPFLLFVSRTSAHLREG
jgi:hypothetical protein